MAAIGPQTTSKYVATEELTLKTPATFSTIEENSPVTVRGPAIWEMSDERKSFMQVPDYIYGCIAPVFTAFTEDEQFDPDGQRNLLDFMLQSGEMPHTPKTKFLRRSVPNSVWLTSGWNCTPYRFLSVSAIAAIGSSSVLAIVL